MEESLQKCSYVLFICTPNYKKKADEREGGVGYETNVITADLYQSHNDVKYIPVLFAGDWNISMPVWAGGKLGVDLREESLREYDKLLDALEEQEELSAVSEKKDDLEIDQPLEKPVGAEERRALEQFYQELLEFKAWLVGLKSKTGGGIEDPDGAEDRI